MELCRGEMTDFDEMMQYCHLLRISCMYSADSQEAKHSLKQNTAAWTGGAAILP